MYIDVLKLAAGVIYLVLSLVLFVRSLKEAPPGTFKKAALMIGYSLNLGLAGSISLNAIYPLPTEASQQAVVFNLLVPYFFASIVYVMKLLTWELLGYGKT
jgi:hypothetical protein